MRIAIINRDRYSHPGGDVVAIDATVAALARIDVEAVYLPHDCSAEDIAQFDLAHMYHVNFGWCFRDWLKIRQAKKRYVVTPVFYPNYWEVAKSECFTILWDSAAITPFSDTEAREIRFVLDRFNLAMTPIPNGTDPAFHAPNCGSDGYEREGVLCVAARQGDKNTDKVERICKNLGLPFTLATGIPHEQMPEVYRRHRVFVNASDSERMSLTIGEALCAGCRVLATRHNRGNEWYPAIETIDPSNDRDLVAMIENSYHSPKVVAFGHYNKLGIWDFTPNDAARRLTWDATAAMLKQVYEEVLR